MINKIRSYRFILQEDSEDGNDSIWLATIPQHLMLAQALKDRDMKIAIQAIDKINEYGFEIAKKENRVKILSVEKENKSFTL